MSQYVTKILDMLRVHYDEGVSKGTEKLNLG